MAHFAVGLAVTRETAGRVACVSLIRSFSLFPSGLHRGCGDRNRFSLRGGHSSACSKSSCLLFVATSQFAGRDLLRTFSGSTSYQSPVLQASAQLLRRYSTEHRAPFIRHAAAYSAARQLNARPGTEMRRPPHDRPGVIRETPPARNPASETPRLACVSLAGPWLSSDIACRACIARGSVLKGGRHGERCCHFPLGAVRRAVFPGENQGR
jgi:hypothetical protein